MVDFKLDLGTVDSSSLDLKLDLASFVSGIPSILSSASSGSARMSLSALRVPAFRVSPGGNMPRSTGEDSVDDAGRVVFSRSENLVTVFLATRLVGNFPDGPGGAFGLEAAAGAAVEVAACDG